MADPFAGAFSTKRGKQIPYSNRNADPFAGAFGTPATPQNQTAPNASEDPFAGAFQTSPTPAAPPAKPAAPGAVLPITTGEPTPPVTTSTPVRQAAPTLSSAMPQRKAPDYYPDRPGALGAMDDVASGVARGAIAGTAQAVPEVGNMIQNIVNAPLPDQYSVDIPMLADVTGRAIGNLVTPQRNVQGQRIKPTPYQADVTRTSGQRLDETRAEMRQYMDDSIEKIKFFRPSRQAVADQESGDPFAWRGGLRSGAESAGLMVPIIAASAVNPALANVLTWNLYGAPEANDFIAEARKNGMTAGKMGLGAAAQFILQGGVETASTIIERRLFGQKLPKPLKDGLGRWLMEVGKRTVRGYPGALATELLEEVAQGEGGEFIKRLTGLNYEEFGRRSLQAIIPVATSVALFGPVMAASQMRGERNFVSQRDNLRQNADRMGAPDAIRAALQNANTENEWNAAAQGFKNWVDSSAQNEAEQAGKRLTPEDQASIIEQATDLQAIVDAGGAIPEDANPLAEQFRQDLADGYSADDAFQRIEASMEAERVELRRVEEAASRPAATTGEALDDDANALKLENIAAAGTTDVLRKPAEFTIDESPEAVARRRAAWTEARRQRGQVTGADADAREAAQAAELARFAADETLETPDTQESPTTSAPPTLAPSQAEVAASAASAKEKPNALPKRVATPRPLGEGAGSSPAVDAEVRQQAAQGAAQPDAAAQGAVAKPQELMTPEEFNAELKASWIRSAEQGVAAARYLETSANRSNDEGIAKAEAELIGARQSQPDGKDSHSYAVWQASHNPPYKPVSAAAVDAYEINLPKGYVREGDQYVFKPQPDAAAQDRVEKSVNSDARQFAADALKQRNRDVSDYRKRAAVERTAGREEMAQRYDGIADDYMSVSAEQFTQDVIANPDYYLKSNVDPFLRFKNREVNRTPPTQEPTREPRPAPAQTAKPQRKKAAARPAQPGVSPVTEGVAGAGGEGVKLAVGDRIPWKNSPDPNEAVREIEIVKLTPTIATVRWVGGSELQRLPRAAVEKRIVEGRGGGMVPISGSYPEDAGSTPAPATSAPEAPAAPPTTTPSRKRDALAADDVVRAAEKAIGFPLRNSDGTWRRGLLVTFAANGKPYRKAPRAQIVQVLDAQTLSVRYRRPGQVQTTVEAMPLQRIQESTGGTRRRELGAILAGLSPQERATVTRDARAFDDIIMVNEPFTTGDDVNLIENQQFQKQRGIELSKHKRYARELAARELGQPDADMGNPIVRAGLLPALRTYLDTQQAKSRGAEIQANIAAIKAADAEDDTIPMDASELPDGALVYKDGEWLRVQQGRVTVRLQDGTTEQYAPDDTVEIAGVLAPGDPGYEEALRQYNEQVAAEPEDVQAARAQEEEERERESNAQRNAMPQRRVEVAPSGQAQLLSQAEGGFTLVSDTVRQRKAAEPAQPSMFGVGEMRGRALDDLDAKDIKALRLQAVREEVDLSGVSADPARVRDAIRAARRAKAEKKEAPPSATPQRVEEPAPPPPKRATPVRKKAPAEPAPAAEPTRSTENLRIIVGTAEEISAAAPDRIFVISQGNTYFTLWTKPLKGRRWNYLSILPRTEAEAIAAARQSVEDVASGKGKLVAFIGGKEKDTVGESFGLITDRMSAEDLMEPEKIAIGEQELAMGRKYPNVRVKDLFATDTNYALWAAETLSGSSRARAVSEYLRSRPEYAEARNAELEKIRAIMTPENIAALKERGVDMTDDGGIIVLGGKTYDLKSQIKAAGGKWSENKTWTLSADAAEKFIHAVRGLPATPGGQGSQGRSGVSDPRLVELRRTVGERPDRSRLDRPAGEIVGEDTQRLLRLGEKAQIPESVITEQIEDVAKIKTSYQNGNRMFLVASEPGSGKTFVLGAAIRELRQAGAKKIVYVTLRRELIDQIKNDLAAYEIGDVRFITYPEMRTGVPEDTDALIFDEAHSVKNVDAGGEGAQQAKAAAKWIRRARMTIFSTATPFENPVQAAYLEPTGVFDPWGSHRDFAMAHGADTFKIRAGDREVEVLRWKRSPTSDADAQAARDFFMREGVFTSRPIRLPAGMVDARMSKVTAAPELAKQYAALTDAAEKHENTLMGFGRAWVVNLQKRILEAAKVQRGIQEAKSALQRGRNPIIFVETKAERNIDIPELVRNEEQWARDYAMAVQNHDKPPSRKDYGLPPGGVVDVLSEYMKETGEEKIVIPSAEDIITKALDEKNVAIFTGSVTPTKAQKNLDDWRAGRKRVIVATMAKGGTGLSLHDKVGDHPTTQIVINMPWTATQVKQVAQRNARYGLKSKAEINWIFAENIPFDRMLASRVGGRMADMGASVYGDVIPEAGKLENWDFEAQTFAESETTPTPRPEEPAAGGGDAAFSTPSTPPLYSALARAVDALPANFKAPADQFRARLEGMRNKGQPWKQQEADESGFADWLAMRAEQGAAVTRDEAAEFLRGNGVRVKTITKGTLNLPEGWKIEATEPNAEGTRTLILSDPLDRFQGEYDSELEAIRAANKATGKTGETKFSQWAPPNGVPGTYREVLITVPVDGREKELDRINREYERQSEAYADIERRRRENLWTAATEPESFKAEVREVVEWGRDLDRQRAEIKQAVHDASFRSSHWSEPNVIAHMLMDERRIPLDVLERTQPELAARLRAEGKSEARALHMIEGQSDLHQEGAAKGYDTGKKGKALFDAAKEFYYKIWIPHQRGQMTGKDANAAFDELSTRTGFSKADIQDEGAKRGDFTNEYVDPGVPALPMRGDAWKRLVIRSMLREAAAGDYDLLTWSTGADRFKKWGSQRVEWRAKEPTADIRKLRSEAFHEMHPGASWGSLTKDQRNAVAVEARRRIEANRVPTWTVAATEQTGGEHAGLNLEEAARERGVLLEKNGVTVRTKEDLRRVIESIRRGDDTNVEKLTERIWARMQAEPEGTSLPRKEFFEFLYDTSFVNEARDIVRRMDKGAGVGAANIKTDVRDENRSRDRIARSTQQDVLGLLQRTGLDDDTNVNALDRWAATGGTSAHWASIVNEAMRRANADGTLESWHQSNIDHSDPVMMAGAVPVHAISITPALRASVAAGQPLYQTPTAAVSSLALDSAQEQGVTFKTGNPVTFQYVHNKESATDIFGKPKKTSNFDRGYEPSGRYVIAGTNDYLPRTFPEKYESGSITFRNPIVMSVGEYGTPTSWKRALSKAFGGARGKNLSVAILQAGYDGVVTIGTSKTGEKYTSEILDLTTFDYAKARYDTAPLDTAAPSMIQGERNERENDSAQLRDRREPRTVDAWRRRVRQGVARLRAYVHGADGADSPIARLEADPEFGASQAFRDAEARLAKLGLVAIPVRNAPFRGYYAGNGEVWLDSKSADPASIPTEGDAAKHEAGHFAYANPSTRPLAQALSDEINDASRVFQQFWSNLEDRHMLQYGVFRLTPAQIKEEFIVEWLSGKRGFWVNGERVPYEGAFRDAGRAAAAREAFEAGMREVERAQGAKDAAQARAAAMLSPTQAMGEQGGAAMDTPSARAQYAVKPPRKLYRGTRAATGSGTYSLGRGRYSSPDNREAAQYGKVAEVSVDEYWPRNPLVLQGSGSAAGLLMGYVYRNSAYKNAREFNRDYPDPGVWVRQQGFDGVVAGDEVVRYMDDAEQGGGALSTPSTPAQSPDIRFSTPDANATRDEFARLTATLKLPAGTRAERQAALNAWIVAHPEEYAALEKMREGVLKRQGYTSPRVFRGSVEDDGVELPTSFEAGGGIFLTDSEDVAAIFTYPREYGEVITSQYDEENDEDVDIEPGPIIKAHVRMTNPLVLTRDTDVDSQDFVQDTAVQSAVIKQAQKDGYDGIIVKDTKEGVGDWMADGTTYVVFESSQVKLADPLALDASGSLITPEQWGDVESPDIRFSTPDASTNEAANVDARKVLQDSSNLFTWLVGQLPRQGGHNTFSAESSEIKYQDQLAQSGSSYIKMTDKRTDEELTVRFSNHFAPGGGGYRVDMFGGAGRSSPPNYNVVKGSVYERTSEGWKKITPSQFLQDIASWRNSDESPDIRFSTPDAPLTPDQRAAAFERGVTRYAREHNLPYLLSREDAAKLRRRLDAAARARAALPQRKREAVERERARAGVKMSAAYVKATGEAYLAKTQTPLAMFRAAMKVAREKQKAETLPKAVRLAVDTVFEDAAKKLSGRERTPKAIRAIENMAEQWSELREAARGLSDEQRRVMLRRALMAILGPDTYAMVRRASLGDIDKTVDILRERAQYHLNRFYGRGIASLLATVRPETLHNIDLKDEEGNTQPGLRNQWLNIVEGLRELNKRAIAIRDQKRWTARMRSENADAATLDKADKKIAAMQAALEDDLAKDNRDWRDMRKMFEDLTLIRQTSQNLQARIKELRNQTVDEAAAEAAEHIKESGEPLKPGRYDRAPFLRRLMYDLRGNMKTWAMQMFGREGSVGEDILVNMPRRSENLRDSPWMSTVQGFFREAERLGITPAELDRFVTKRHTVNIGGFEHTYTGAELMDLYAYRHLDAEGQAVLAANGHKEGAFRDLNEPGRHVVREADEDADPLAVHDAPLRLLPEPYRQLVEWMSEHLTAMGGPANETMMRVYGFEKFFSDAYWPRTVDRSDRQGVEGKDMLEKRRFEESLAGLGLAKARVQHGHPVLLGNAINKFFDHAYKMASLTHMLETEVMTNRFLGNPALRSAIVEYHGRDRLRSIKNSLKRVMGLKHHADNWNGIERLFAAIRRRMSTSILGFRVLSSGVKNWLPGQILMSAELGRINRAWQPQFLAYVTPPAGARYQAAQDAVMSRGMLTKRWTLDPSMVYANLPDLGEAGNVLSLFKRRFTMWALRYMSVIERHNATKAFLFLTSKGMGREQALDIVEVATRGTQNPSSGLDETRLYSAIQEVPIAGLAVPFFGQPSVQSTMALNDMIRLRNAIRTGQGQAKAWSDLAGTLSAVALNAGFNALLLYGLRSLRQGPGDDDEDKKEASRWMAYMVAVSELLDSFVFPGLGRLAYPLTQFARSIKGKIDSGTDISAAGEISKLLGNFSDEVSDNLLARFGAKVKTGFDDATKGWSDEDWGRFYAGVLDLVDTGGMATGLPTGGLVQMLETGAGAVGYPLEPGGFEGDESAPAPAARPYALPQRRVIPQRPRPTQQRAMPRRRVP